MSEFTEYEFTLVLKVMQKGVDAQDAFSRMEQNLRLWEGKRFFHAFGKNHTDEQLFTTTVTQTVKSLAHKKTGEE